MSRADLVSLARSNVSTHSEGYQALLATWAADGNGALLQGFHDHCHHHWAVSMNMGWEALKGFLDLGKPSNIYQFKDAPRLDPESISPGDSPIDWGTFLAVLEAHFGDAAKHFAPLRMIFNRYALLEEDFHYGAYYVAGRGIPRYGKQMLILKKGFIVDSQNVCFLKGDSLLDYMTPTAADTTVQEVNVPKLLMNLALPSSVTEMLCLNKSADLARLGHEGCLETVTCDTAYMEAYITESIGYDAIEKVRIRKLNEVELQLMQQILTGQDLRNAEGLDGIARKNVYFYLLFSDAFPKKGVPVEEF